MTFMLTARELADLRADILITLVSTCDIRRAVIAAPNAYGESVPTTSTVATAIPCRLDPHTIREDGIGLVAGREANRTYFMLTLRYDANILDGDQVIFGSDVLEVLQLFAVHSDNAVKRAICARLAS